MKTFDPAMLARFSDSDQFHIVGQRYGLSEGAMYVAEHAKCFWLMLKVAEHLGDFCLTDPTAKASAARSKTGVTLVIFNRKDVEVSREFFEGRSLPVAELRLSACWFEKLWLLMLPNEV
jgi:hypothetical protein